MAEPIIEAAFVIVLCCILIAFMFLFLGQEQILPQAANGYNLTVTPAAGFAPYTYQWYSGLTCTIPIAGQTSAIYSVAPGTAVSVKITDSDAETFCISYG